MSPSLKMPASRSPSRTRTEPTRRWAITDAASPSVALPSEVTNCRLMSSATVAMAPPWSVLPNGAPGELGDGGADLVRRVLLDEVNAAHRDLCLVAQPPAKRPLRSG